MSLEAIFDHAFAPLAEAVAAGRITGGVLGIVDATGQRITRATGLAQRIPIERKMTETTWFDLASLTKVLFTTPRILALAGQWALDLDAPITSAIPDFAQQNLESWQRKVTFRQCLGHQTAFPGIFPLYTYGSDPNLLRHFVLQRDWSAGPAVYSDINFILLGIAIERLAGRTMRQIDPGPGFALSADPAEARRNRRRPLARPHAGWRGA